MKETRRRIALAITGASGAIYGLRVLEELVRDKALEVHLSISPAAQQILEAECNVRVDLRAFQAGALGVKGAERAVYHAYDDLMAPLASGSFRLDAMAIVPCSMACAAAVAHGMSRDLVERTADVMLKERRPVVVVPREAPLSAVHLENLLALARLGVSVIPASPGFYGRPKTVAAMVDFVVARVLDHVNVEHDLGPRWGSQ
jgi:4-hydroxy-3-polyprenylbenzoate decarboxylase